MDPARTMGIMDMILGLFKGSGSGPDFAKLDPNDVHAYARAKREIDDAEREGEDALKAAWAKYGLRSDDHWSEVRSSFMTKHRQNYEMLFAEALLSSEEAFRKAAESGHPLPPEVTEPIEGITLHLLAVLNAATEEPGADVNAVCSRFGTTPAAYERAKEGWNARMASSQDAFSANMHSGDYHAFYRMAKAFVSKGYAIF